VVDTVVALAGLHAAYDTRERVIFGHAPFHGPLMMENKVFIDAGAVMGHTQTYLEFPAIRFHAMDAWMP
jgi:hypothetical protein